MQSQYAIIKPNVPMSHTFTGETFWTKAYADEMVRRFTEAGEKVKLVIITEIETPEA